MKSVPKFEGLCEFMSLPSEQWIFSADNRSRKMSAPWYGAGQDGIPKGYERAIKRCPLCGKRLRLRARYCIGGEFTNWILPEHKARETKKPGPRRSSRAQGRGK